MKFRCRWTVLSFMNMVIGASGSRTIWNITYFLCSPCLLEEPCFIHASSSFAQWSYNIESKERIYDANLHYLSQLYSILLVRWPKLTIVKYRHHYLYLKKYSKALKWSWNSFVQFHKWKRRIQINVSSPCNNVIRVASWYIFFPILLGCTIIFHTDSEISKVNLDIAYPSTLWIEMHHYTYLPSIISIQE